MDSSTLVSAIGICCALAGMAVLIFKRVTPVIIGPLAAVLSVLQVKSLYSADLQKPIFQELQDFSHHMFLYFFSAISLEISIRIPAPLPK